jgi:hypothetical protein
MLVCRFARISPLLPAQIEESTKGLGQLVIKIFLGFRTSSRSTQQDCWSTFARCENARLSPFDVHKSVASTWQKQSVVLRHTPIVKFLRYTELKGGCDDNGPAWIGYVTPSKTGRTIYFNSRGLMKLKGQWRGGYGGNYEKSQRDLLTVLMIYPL